MSVVKTEGLDEYDPFQVYKSYKNQINQNSGNQPAVVKTTEIKRDDGWKASENTGLLEQRPMKMSSISEPVQPSLGASDVNGEKNWPPLPSWCPCSPCIYHDISAEIPPRLQRTMRYAYYLWLAYSVVLLINCLGALGYFLSTANSAAGSMEAGATFGTSLIILAILPPASFVLWYRPLYRAARCDSSAHYFIFFVALFGQIVIIAIQCVGINWLGSCGWFNGLVTLSNNKIAGIIMLMIAIFFSVLLASDIILLIKVHQLYRNTDVSDPQKAKSEVAAAAVNSTRDLHDIAASSIKNGSKNINQ